MMSEHHVVSTEATSDAAIDLHEVRKSFGNVTALDGLTMSVHRGQIHGFLGPNGSGKSTFVNCVSGDFAQHDGTVALAGRALDGLKPHRRARLGLARTFTGIITARALSGALNGNVGVVKSMMGELTDETNVARAFAWQPLPWSLGSTFG